MSTMGTEMNYKYLKVRIDNRIIYPPEQLREKVKHYAEELAQKPAEALTAIRRTITEGGALSFDAGLKLEYEIAVKLAGTQDFSEGIQAFLGKRKPKWK